jgi:hypothetical protein
MEAKEKAKELLSLYGNGLKIGIDYAKKTSLKYCDEKKSSIYRNSSFEKYFINNDEMNEVEALAYWDDVKKEIINYEN